MSLERSYSVVFILFAFLSTLCWARVMHIDERLVPGEVFYQRYGAYEPQDSPFGGTRPASLHLNLIFAQLSDPLAWNTTDINMPLGEVLLFHYTQRNHFGVGGFSVLEDRVYCCSRELYNAGICNEVNALIINSPLNRDDLYYTRLTWANYKNSHSIATLTFSTTLSHTGVWYLFLANCESPKRHGVEVAVSGLIEWQNPFGYLSGQILGFLPLYWLTSTIYILLGLVWIVFALKYRNDMVKLQHAITIVIFISIIESLIWASNYTVLNQNGLNSEPTNIFAALFSSFKLTFVRTLMLVVGIGYTITRLEIERNYRIGILVISCTFFVIEATNLYMDVAIAAGRFVDPGWKLFFFVMLVVANIVYFLWIGFEIYITIGKLKEKEAEKLVMYKRLSILLAVCLFISVLIVITFLIIDATENSDEHFRAAWLYQGYWELVYVSCLLFVAWVWRPNENNKRFAYQEFEDEEEVKQDGEEDLPVEKSYEKEKNSEAIGDISGESDDSSTDSDDDNFAGGPISPMTGASSYPFPKTPKLSPAKESDESTSSSSE